MNTQEDKSYSETLGVTSGQTRLTFDGAHSVQPTGIGLSESCARYFIGDNPSQWQSEVATFEGIFYHDLYDGVDLEVTVDDAGSLKYAFYLDAGVDPSVIRVACEGISKLEIDDERNLLIHTPQGILHDSRPVSWQHHTDGSRDDISVEFNQLDFNTWGFICEDDLDPTRDLVIDPKLMMMAYFGGSKRERGRSVTLGPDGSIYLIGRTESRDFDGVNNSFIGGSFDAYVLKVNPQGALDWVTYLGGTGKDWGRSISVTEEGSIYITGLTESTDWPAPTNSSSTGADGFVAKLTSDGTIEWTTYLAGTQNDSARFLLLDEDELYITGFTNSPDMEGMINPAFGGNDVFLTRIDPTTGAIDWTRMIGGTDSDVSHALLIDTDDNIVISGVTASPDFEGAINTYYGGETDAFFAVVARNGDLVRSFFYGGSDKDDAWFMVSIPGQNDILATCTVSSIDLPMRLNSFHGGDRDGYLLRFRPDGTIIHGTYVGGIDWDMMFGLLLLDDQGTVMMCGDSASRDFSARMNDYLGDDPGQWDAVISKVNPVGVVEWSMFLGGGEDEYTYGMAHDGSGRLYLSGSTWSDDFDKHANQSKGGPPDVWLALVNLKKQKQVLMTIEGTCPGFFKATVTNCTPNDFVVLYSSLIQGRFTISQDPCENLVINLDPNNGTIIKSKKADENGVVVFDLGFVIAPECGNYIQAIDLGSCRSGNVVLMR